MDLHANHRRLERHRLGLPYFAFYCGNVVDGRGCVMEIMISRPSQSPVTEAIIVPPLKARAIIDTGCTDTAIRYDLDALLGLPVIGQREVDSASSGDDAVTYPTVLADLRLRDVDGIEICVQHELTAQDMTDDILLGMDLLAGGVLTVDLVYMTWNWKYHKPVPPPPEKQSS